MERLIPLGLLAGTMLLAGCAGTTVTSPVSPADVAAMKSSVTIAETLALNYTRLPACPAATKVCADPVTKLRIKANGQAAHDAVKTLQLSSAAGAPAAMAAAQAALDAFQASIPATPVAN
jgi:hypothetical protein